MPLMSFEKIAPVFLLPLVLGACIPAEEDRAQVGPIVGPFVVSHHFTPSGLMGDGAIPGRLTVDINDKCKKPRPAGAQGDCYHFLYQVGEVKWAGAYWVYPSNNWGTVPGRDLVGPVDRGVDPASGTPLRGYNYVRFYAAIDSDMMKYPLPVAPKVRYWAGKLDGRVAKPPQPYYDKGCSIFPGTPPMCVDTTTTPPGPYFFNPLEEETSNTVPISTEWTQYKVDLSRWSVESVIGAFGFSTNDTENPGATQSIYFDDIVWE